MKISKLLIVGLLSSGVFISTALADYNKGYKYYVKYIKKKSNIKGSEFVKILGVKSNDELKALFKDNAKPLIEKLNKLGYNKAAEGVKKIVKKKKLKDLEDFLIGIMNGKIPAGC